MSKYSKHKNFKVIVIIAVIFVVSVGLTFGGLTLYQNYYNDNHPLDTQSSTVPSITENTDNTLNSSSATTQATTNSDDVATELSNMTLHQKICQMFVVTPEELTGVEVATQAGSATKSALKEYPVGGIVYFAQNIVSDNQITTMIKNAQAYSDIPLLTAVDEEGGIVARLEDKLNVSKLNNMYTYRNDGVATATKNAQTIASYMTTYGFNTDYAPVADVWSNNENTVIGQRAYESDFDRVVPLISAAVKGFENKNMICTLKHFPGHGDTLEDSHKEIAHTKKTEKQLMSQEFKSFQSGIDAGADMVMVGHIVVDSLNDNTPASVNGDIIEGMLRDKLGFDGVVTTDSLSMESIVDTYGNENLAVMAVNAGNDILLMPDNLEEMVSALEDAVLNGKIEESRIDQSVTRILTMKKNHSIM